MKLNYDLCSENDVDLSCTAGSLIGFWREVSKEDGLKRYILKNGLVTTERPADFDSVDYEIYPGGRVVHWGAVQR